MMRRSFFGLSLLTCVACTQNVGTGDLAPPATVTEHATDEPVPLPIVGAPSQSKGVVISTFVTHDARVSILSSQGGSRDLRVVVRTNDGVMVADGVSIDQLRTTDPLLHAIVTTALAKNGGEGTYIDASR